MTARRLEEIDGLLAAGTPAAELLPEFLREWTMSPAYLRRLANLFLHTGNWSRAVATMQLAAGLAPNDPVLKVELGTIISTGGGHPTAQKCYEHALRLDPNNWEAIYSRAQGYHMLCEIDEAIEGYDRCLELLPEALQVLGFRIVARNYRDIEQGRILEESQHYGELLGPEVNSLCDQRSAMRALRVGILSSDLRSHSVAFFLAPLLERTGPSIAVYLYGDSVHEDEMTARLRSMAASFVNTSAWSNESLEQRMLADGLDVAIDLSGHFSRSRLPIFARRVAPKQVAYLGYPNTTGVKAMDWRIADGYIDAGLQEQWTEKLFFLESMLAYEPPADAPPIGPGPAEPTFGYFGTLSKISPECAAVWATLLLAHPGSRLLIKGQDLEDAEMRERWADRFVRWNLPMYRVVLKGKTPSRAEHLALYNEVTVSLDTFPYNGTTTICESLWMGVPVVTLKGSRHASRVGAGLLDGAHLEAYIARDGLEYIDIAGQLLQVRKRLARADLVGAKWLQHDAVAEEFWKFIRS